MANNYPTLNGTTGVITVASNATLNVTTVDMSICGWFDTFTAQTYLCSKYDGTSGYYLGVGAVPNAGKIQFVLVDGVSPPKSIFSNDIIAAGWHHIAATIDRDGNGIIYVDGVANTPTAIGSNLLTLSNAADVLIGKYAASYYAGSVDDVRLYKSVLTATEIAEIYNLGVGKKYAALSTGKTAAAAFQFDEGVGSYTLDSVTGLLGTITGGTWASGGVPFAITTSVEQSLYYVLANDASVAALVAARIYPAIVPERAAVPAITYQQISGDREHDMDDAIGYATGRFQVNCWDDSYSGARVLADAVRKALDGYTGSAYGLHIHHLFLTDEGDMPEVEPELNSTRIRYGKRLDFEITWAESI